MHEFSVEGSTHEAGFYLSSLTALSPCGSSTALEISAHNSGITFVSMSVLEDMWAKAERLISMKDGILKVLWSTDSKARLVMSVSSDHPHVVKINPSSKKQYICDDKCLMFKGYLICSHTVATAHVNDDFSSFIEHYKQKKAGPNLTAIAGHGMTIERLWRGSQEEEAV